MHHRIAPALAAMGEVVAVGDQALVQLACEHRNPSAVWAMPKPVTGHADLAAADFGLYIGIKFRPADLRSSARRWSSVEGHCVQN